MNTEKFIKTFAKPTKIDNEWGYHPFNIVSLEKDGLKVFSVTCPRNGVEGMYKLLKKTLLNKPEVTHLAIDFPKRMGLKHDYIGVFTIINKNISVCMIPYDTKTGKTFPIIKNHIVIDFMKKEIEMVLYNKRTIYNYQN